MTKASSHSRCLRRLALLTGTATLAAAITAPAYADTLAIGARTLVNSQTDANIVSAVIDGASATIDTNQVVSSAVENRDNSVSAAVRGNQATNSFSPDALDLAGFESPTWLSADGWSVWGEAGAILANEQKMEDPPVDASVTASRIAVNASKVRDSSVTVEGNSQNAAAFANDAASTLALSGVDVSSGAGLVSYQGTDWGTPVTAVMDGNLGIRAGRVKSSEISLTENMRQAYAAGNNAGNGLSVEAAAIEAPTSYSIGSVVPRESDAAPEVAAAYGLLASQSLRDDVSAHVTAMGGAGFSVKVQRDVDGSSLSNDANATQAIASGNRAASALSLDAVSIARAPAWEGDPEGAIANVTNVQRIDEAGLKASASGAASTRIGGDVSDTSASVSSNLARAVALGNVADANRLTITADSIDAVGTSEGGGGGGWEEGGDEEGPGYVGTAHLAYDGTLTASAAFSIQNLQDYGNGIISAKQSDTGARLTVGGDLSRSALAADGNTTVAGATGNTGVNALAVEATRLAASADVNSFQTGRGDVHTALGSAHAPIGAKIEVRGAVEDSSVAVRGNTALAASTGNSVSNDLEVDANQIAHGTNHGDAVAGWLPGGIGASADYALASVQKLEAGPSYGSESGYFWPEPIRIEAKVNGAYSIAGRGIDRSSLRVEDNAQAATTLGNDAVNRLSLDAASIDGNPAAGTALSNKQSALADMSAVSKMRLSGSGDLLDSALSITGNANQAAVSLNRADSQLTVDAVEIGAVAGGNADLTLDYRFASAEGDHVLANNQFAFGEASARAQTSMGNDDPSHPLSGSRITIADNETSATAAANLATNVVSVTAGSGREANAGLTSIQVSFAGVAASANTRVDIAGGRADASALGAVANTTASLARGNAADNRLTLTGGSGDAWPSQPMVAIGAGGPDVMASAALLNAQTNYGPVAARSDSSGHSAVLNGYGASSSSIGVTSNAVAATAVGNAVYNQVTLASLDRLPTAAIGNRQINYGPVTARVSGASHAISAGMVNASALSITGNQANASATGNQATNLITSPR